jgi:hypothetical protein
MTEMTGKLFDNSNRGLVNPFAERRPDEVKRYRRARLWILLKQGYCHLGQTKYQGIEAGDQVPAKEMCKSSRNALIGVHLRCPVPLFGIPLQSQSAHYYSRLGSSPVAQVESKIERFMSLLFSSGKCWVPPGADRETNMYSLHPS